MPLKIFTVAVIALVATHASVRAEYVTPAVVNAQMKHADVSFENGAISVHVDETVATPRLEPLAEGDEFDPDGAWGHLNDHAYNLQYGWNPSRFVPFPPAGTWVWIEQIDATPGLEVYERDPSTGAEGDPLFGTAGSSARWRWSGVMTHNLYAVESPTLASYSATYQVYIGYDASGDPVPEYDAAQVTFTFAATPALPGDFNGDGAVDLDDYQVWRTHFGAEEDGDVLAGNGNGGTVDASDYTLWRDNFGSPTDAASVVAAPEPAAWLLLMGGAFAALRRSR